MTERGSDGRSGASGRALKRGLRLLDLSVSLKVILATLVLLGLGAALFLFAGGVNVYADRPDGFFTRTLLHSVFQRSESTRSISVSKPSDFADPSRVRLAAQHYDMVCANCHGRPGYGQSVVPLSMSPRPQYLPFVLNEFTDPELALIVEHGVKFSAMPSWPTARRRDEVWSMVAFLRQLQKMDAKTYHAMTALPGDVAGAPTDPAGGATLQPANIHNDAPPADQFAYAAPSAGFEDQSVHQNPVPTCARCHGADGSGAATGGEAPNLTLQDAGYLQAALDAYVHGDRKSGYMQNVATQLSQAQIVALSHYFAGLPVRTVAAPPADPALVRRGETIATQGIPESATPACQMCHDSQGAKITGAPHIAGQSAAFLRHQLGVLSQGGRGSTGPWNPMSTVAHTLSERDIAALAAYYSGLQPTKSAAASPAPQAAPAAGANSSLGAAKAIFLKNCATCHGVDGRGDRQGVYPNLTIHTTPFVTQSLYAYHAALESSVQMRQATLDLSFEDMRQLARYVNGLAPQPGLATPNAAAAARGAAIATGGIPSRGVPACLGCHGASGVAELPLVPRLQGQNAFYLRAKLSNYAQPYAKNLPALNPMPPIASRLSDQERSDLAAYFAAAAPLPKSAPQP